MEELETKGLVISEVRTGEADKILTLLTAEHGKITVSGKGVASLRSRHMPATQLFSYSSFNLKKTKKYFYIADSDLIEPFFDIRYDVNKLSLANYICEVVDYLAVEEMGEEELLRLALNSLYALANRDGLPEEQIKAAFEMRAAAVSGFEPSLDKCGECGNDETDGLFYLDVMNGRLICGDCLRSIRGGAGDDRTAKIYLALSPSVLEAIRFTVHAPIGRFLSFQIEDDELKPFAVVCEKYLLSHIEHGFRSLDYYNSLIRNGYTDE